jgi:GT2 family glycosyltransferase
VTYSDVDLCCRVRQRGLRVAVTPHARLLHYEGLTRGFAPDEPGEGHLAGLERFPSAT